MLLVLEYKDIQNWVKCKAWRFMAQYRPFIIKSLKLFLFFFHCQWDLVISVIISLKFTDCFLCLLHSAVLLFSPFTELNNNNKNNQTFWLLYFLILKSKIFICLMSISSTILPFSYFCIFVMCVCNCSEIFLSWLI